MVAEETVVRFEPRGAVLEALRSAEPELCLSGAAGTGKTVGALMKGHLALLGTPGARVLLARKTLTSLTSSTLVSFRKMVAREALDAGLLAWFGGSSVEPASFRYRNGSTLVVGSLEKSQRLLSSEYDIAIVDEAIETDPTDLDVIVTRLRHGRLKYQQLILCTNPGPPSHHIKLRCDAGRTRMLYSQHEDNPRLYDNGEWTEYGKTYLARLDSLVGVRYERLRWGRWVASEGQVYTAFNPAEHVVDPFPIPDTWGPWFTSVDFGFTNPTVAQHHVLDPDGRLYLVAERYRSRRLVEDHAKDIRADWDRLIGPGKRPRAVICDHDAEDRATLERHLGVSTIPAKKTVSDGIQAVQSRLAPAGDGRPRLFLFRGATVQRDRDLEEAKRPTSTEQEFGSYVWPDPVDGKPVKDAPVKMDDHGMDALRYMVAELDLGARPRVRFM